MSRKTEFRGMRQNGDWLFGDLVHFDNAICIFPFDADWHEVVQPDRRISPEYIVMPETVGQFTGLLDKSEPPKKIFEGDTIDIVYWVDIANIFDEPEMKMREITSNVVYMDHIAGFDLFTIESSHLHCGYNLACGEDAEVFEVTGNIHEK